MGSTWLFFGLFLLQTDMSLSAIFLHLVVLSMILVLAVEDWRDFTISDRLTVPMILITLFIIRLAQELDILGYLPTLPEALLG
jgi:Flp pilus assembly protein protease CpaA